MPWYRKLHWQIITGDATVAAIVAATEGQLGVPVGDAVPQES